MQKAIIAILLLSPSILNAQTPARSDTAFLQTVIVGSNNKNADFNGRRYDGQARTERLLDNLPGVDLISRGNYAQEPVLRGMSDGQINITINGMHLFGACTDRMDPITAYIEPNNLKSVQVFSGPSFNSCGATIGGGLNFDLRQAQTTDQKKLSGSIGTGFETNAASRQFLGNLQYSGKRFAFTIDGIYRKAGDYTPGGKKSDNIAKYGNWDQANGFTVDSKGRINFSQYQKWNVHANAVYNIDAHQNLTIDYLQDQANNTGYPALTMDMAKATSNTASITHEFKNPDKAFSYWQTKVYYNDINHRMDNSRRPMDEMPMEMMMSMTGHSQTGGAYTQAYWKAAPAQLIKAKIETYINRWHADMNMMPMDSSMSGSGMMPMSMLTIPNAQRTVVGADLTDEIGLSRTWLLTPGIHAEYDHSSSDSASAGNAWLYNAFIDLGYHPASPFALDLKLARGMRASTLRELYANYLYNRVDGYDYIGNPGIRMETSFNGEINLSYKSHKLEATLKGFGYFFNNYIAGFAQQGMSAMTPGAIGVKQYGNIGSASIVGVSAIINYHLSPKLLVSSNTTWQHGEDKNKNALPLITPLKSINTLSYAAGGWRLFGDELLSAARRNASAFYGETPNPGFAVTDAGADKTFGMGKSQLILGLTCNNIFNTYYYETPDVIKLPREGRNFILHATYAF